MKLVFAGPLFLILFGCAQLPDASEETRPQDSHPYAAPVEKGFAALPGAPDSYRWVGNLDGAAYRIEVPKQGWNGTLVMWARGYTGEDLAIGTPLFRRYLLDHGYAWAASSYHKGNYDVRAGIEDTNELALAFQGVAKVNGVKLDVPQQYIISGTSMGGHIAEAAVEKETRADEIHQVRYAGALPLCASGIDLLDYNAAYHHAVVKLAGLSGDTRPWPELSPIAKEALFSTYPSKTTAQGAKLEAIDRNLSGGDRPFFAEAFANKEQQGVLMTLGVDNTVEGILNQSITDTRNITYRFETVDGPLSAAEVEFNQTVVRDVPVEGANRRRHDGLRWIPEVQGNFDVPVLTLHDLGDVWVPLSLEQIYRRRAVAMGNDALLVQRVIRDVGHCHFTAAEGEQAFIDLTNWIAGGQKPAGDDVLSADALSSPTAGCRFTRNEASHEDRTRPQERALYQSHYPACPT
jgi:hypothetical protein